MSNDKQPQHRPAANGPLADIKGIPIAVLQFRDMVEIPGRLTSQGLKSEMEQTNRKRWRIIYLPALRHVQLEHYSPNRDTPDGTFFIHEQHVMWWSPA